MKQTPGFVSTEFISPTVHTAGLAAIETLINRALALDPASRRRLGELSEQAFLLDFRQPTLKLYVTPTAEGIRLQGHYEGKVRTQLSGTASEFLKLLTAEDPANALINGDLQLQGDTQALLELQAIASDLDLDWEAPLAKVFGDIAGHQLGRGIRGGFKWGLQAAKGLRRQLDEYLIEDSELLAPRWQLERFFNEVDQLAMRTDRLSARVDKLLQKKSQSTTRKPTVSGSTPLK